VSENCVHEVGSQNEANWIARKQKEFLLPLLM